MRTLSIAILVAACSSHPGSSPETGIDAPGMTGDGGSGSGSGSNMMMAHDATIFTIVMENHDYKEIVGSAGSAGSNSPGYVNAPYINSLIAKYGLATNYKDTEHPSTPNYLDLISGSNQYGGGIDVGPQTIFLFPAAQPNLATQLEAANIKWRSYAEGAGSAGCQLNDTGEYVARHVPFLYFTDQQSGSGNLCADTNVDYSQFAADLATNNYRYMWITPNLLDDGHDPGLLPSDFVTSLKQSDTWLSQTLPAILASPGYTNGGVVFITWDEAEGRNGDDKDQIPMIVISPKLKAPGMNVTDPLTHSSYTATVEDLLGLPRLGTVTNTPTLLGFFN
jgi:phosphatidylinositol-3-phosphatase